MEVFASGLELYPVTWQGLISTELEKYKAQMVERFKHVCGSSSLLLLSYQFWNQKHLRLGLKILCTQERLLERLLEGSAARWLGGIRSWVPSRSSIFKQISAKCCKV